MTYNAEDSHAAEVARVLAVLDSSQPLHPCEVMDAAEYLAKFTTRLRRARLETLASFNCWQNLGGDQRACEISRRMRSRLVAMHDRGVYVRGIADASSVPRGLKGRQVKPEQERALAQRGAATRMRNRQSPWAPNGWATDFLGVQHAGRSITYPTSTIAKSWAIDISLSSRLMDSDSEGEQILFSGNDAPFTDGERAMFKAVSAMADPIMVPLEQLARGGWLDEKLLSKEFHTCVRVAADNDAWHVSMDLSDIKRKYSFLLEQSARLHTYCGMRLATVLAGGRAAHSGDKTLANQVARTFRRKKVQLIEAYRGSERWISRVSQDLKRHFLRVTGEEFRFGKCDHPHSIILRLVDPRFWRKRIARVRRDVRLNVARHLGRIGGPQRGLQLYLPDEAVEERHFVDEDTVETMKQIFMKDSAGQVRNLHELAMSGPSNDRNQMVEFFTRVEGLARYCEQRDCIPLFTVATLESEWHRFSTVKGAQIPNPKFNNLSAKDGVRALANRWKLVRAGYKGNDGPIGFRTVEAHQDGCAHANFITFVPRSVGRAGKWGLRNVVKLVRRFRAQFLEKHASDEEGAKRRRLKFKLIRTTKDDSTITQAVMSYVSKMIFSHIKREPNTDPDRLPVRTRFQTWAAELGIRRFQFFGTKPINLWREVRRLGAGRIPALQAMLDDGLLDRWPESFRAAHMAACGYEIIHLDSKQRAIRKVGRPDYGIFLQITEPLKIRLIKSSLRHDPARLDDLELAERTRLADLLKINFNILGPGRYGDSLPSSWSHFAIFVGETGHMVPVQDRSRWIACESDGSQIKQTDTFHEELHPTLNSLSANFLSPVNLSTLLQLFIYPLEQRERVKTDFDFERAMRPVWDFVMNEEGRLTPVRLSEEHLST